MNTEREKVARGLLRRATAKLKSAFRVPSDYSIQDVSGLRHPFVARAAVWLQVLSKDFTQQRAKNIAVAQVSRSSIGCCGRWRKGIKVG